METSTHPSDDLNRDLADVCEKLEAQLKQQLVEMAVVKKSYERLQAKYEELTDNYHYVIDYAFDKIRK